jgi:hypothetical protein
VGWVQGWCTAGQRHGRHAVGKQLRGTHMGA